MIVYKTDYSDDPFYPVYSHPDWLHPEERPLRNFPLMVDIETTNACDSKCTFCARKLMERKPSYMDFDIYTKIIDEAVREDAKFLRVHGWGEPLLHPDVVKQVEYASERGVAVRLTTNGRRIAAKPELAESVIRAGAAELLISMQGLEKESYEDMRKPNSFENFLRTIETCHEAKQRLGAKTYISIITSVFADEHKEDNLERFKEKFMPLVDKLGVDFTHMTFLEEHEDVTQYSDGYLFEKVRRPCVEVLIKTHVNSNGDILYCGNDYDGDLHKIGNLREMSIKEAWNSDKLNKWRKVVRETSKQDGLFYCRQCYDFTTKYDDLKAESGQ